MKIDLKDINDDLILQRGNRSVRVFNQLKDVEESDYWVDMGLPSGLLWAKANIDVTTQSKFQEVNGEVSPYTEEMSYFSWGNTDGHNPISASAFEYDFGTVNSQEPYYEGQPYGETRGAALTGDITPSFDAARANLGAPWRLPTHDEVIELFDNCDFVQPDGETVISGNNKQVTVNNITGIYLKSKSNNNLLFIPVSGFGNGTTWGNKDYIFIPSATISSTSASSYGSWFSSTNAALNAYIYRHFGLPIRPVL